MDIFIQIYIYIYSEMVDCGESEKMMKINGKNFFRLNIFENFFYISAKM